MSPCFHVVLYAEKLRLMIPCFFEKFLHSSKIIVLLLVSLLYFGKLDQMSFYSHTLCGSTHVCLRLCDLTHLFPLLEILPREMAHACVLHVCPWRNAISSC